MSGIGIQKLNGNGTKMQELIDLIAQNVGSSLRNEAIELYGYKKPVKMAVTYANFGTFSFSPAYGRYNLSIIAFNGGGSDGVITWKFYKGSEVVQRLQSQMIAGARDTKQHSFIGSFDSVEVIASLGTGLVVDTTLDFNGFSLAIEAIAPFPMPVVEIDASDNGNVSLSAQDLTALGYTYQWSEQDGLGSFVNPNQPNSVFVADYSGNYNLVLVVTDDLEVSSLPLVIPVTVLKTVRITLEASLSGKLRVWTGHDNTFYLVEGENLIPIYADEFVMLQNITDNEIFFDVLTLDDEILVDDANISAHDNWQNDTLPLAYKIIENI